MYARTYGAAALGVDGILIDVEVDVANGLPGFEMGIFYICPYQLYLALWCYIFHSTAVALIGSLPTAHLCRKEQHHLVWMIMPHYMQASPIIAIPYRIRIPDRRK